MPDRYSSVNRHDDALVSYKPVKGKTYKDICDYCGKEFEFKSSDIKDRVIKCPYCKKDIQFFMYLYK